MMATMMCSIFRKDPSVSFLFIVHVPDRRLVNRVRDAVDDVLPSSKRTACLFSPSNVLLTFACRLSDRRLVSPVRYAVDDALTCSKEHAC